MTCPDCKEVMLKAEFQCEDLSGWNVAWICECEHGDPNIELHIWSKNDWTAETQIKLTE